MHKRTWEKANTKIWDDEVEVKSQPSDLRQTLKKLDIISKDIKEALSKASLIDVCHSTNIMIKDVYSCEDGICVEVLLKQDKEVKT